MLMQNYKTNNIENERLHENSNDNGVKTENSRTSKHLIFKSSMLPNRRINLLLAGTHNQLNRLLIEYN
jgi:hypothetical protein